MNQFDTKAAVWDQNPVHWDRSVAIADGIKLQIPLTKDMNALEYGAGTGIASFLLKDLVKSITLMDNSTEMVKVIKEKILTTKASNLRVLNFDLEENEYKEKKFDLIFTQMVLHHVSDVDNLIKQFYKMLNPGGYLAIADLYEEDGSFHGAEFEGHNGFDIVYLSDLITKNKFVILSRGECYVIERQVSETETLQFPIFLIIAKRND